MAAPASHRETSTFPPPPPSPRYGSQLDFEDLSKAKFFLYMPLGSIFVRSIIYPLSLTKTRMQVEPPPGVQPYRSTFHALSSIARTEGGVRALYKGFGVSLLSVGVGPIYLGALETSRSVLRRWFASAHDPASTAAGSFAPRLSDDAAAVAVSFGAGVCASAVSQTAVVPLDIVSQHQMVDRGATAASTASNAASTTSRSTGRAQPATLPLRTVVRDVVATHGVKGLWRGYSASLLTYAPSSAIMWATFSACQSGIGAAIDRFTLDDSDGDSGSGGGGDGADGSSGAGTRQLDPTGRSMAVSFVSGLTAGSTAAVLTHPLDVIRARHQLSTSARTSLRHTVRELVREHGAAGFARGLSARIMSTSTSAALFLPAYELLKRMSVSDEFVAAAVADAK